MKNKERILSEFLETHTAADSKRVPDTIKKSLDENTGASKDELLGIFAALCDRALLMQESGTLGDIAMINISFLRIGLAEGKGLYRLDVCDEHWLAAKIPCFALWNAKLAFEPYFEQANDLKRSAIDFGYGLREVDIEGYVYGLSSLPRLAADAFLADSVPALGMHPSYAALAKAEDCAITLGEYRDSQTILYPI
jgi:hypothetical protein